MSAADEILDTLDAACGAYAFPMLDNGYVYLAATRLSLFRSSTDWAMVIEVFGYSPRAGMPDLAVATFASRLHKRNPASNYVSDDAYRNYLRVHPHDDSRNFYPLDDGPWIEEELVSDEPGVDLRLRGKPLSIPSRRDYAQLEIELESPERVHVFELCRYVAARHRDEVLATSTEQRVSVMPDMQQLLQLDEWHHPDLADDQRPSELETFRQLAEVLATGDVSRYQPTVSANTHWKHWPDGGTL
jgi:hypothetical protein